MDTSPRQTLRDARAAATAGDYPTAQALYEHFFDHALEVDESFYGVRLSYCLDEWAELGEAYPPALDTLKAKAAEAVAGFEATRNPELFHDYQSILHYLNQNDEVFAQFVGYHETMPELAKLASDYLWDSLVESAHWDLCTAYLGDAKERYETAVSNFDLGMQTIREDPSLREADIERLIRNSYVRDVGNLFRVLKNTHQNQLLNSLDTAACADMLSRGESELIARVHSWMNA